MKLPRERNKYGNKKTGGFASKREHLRYHELKILEMAGEISDLKTQVSFEIVPKNDKFRAVKYIADFAYNDINGNRIVEDSKGFETQIFKLKRKLMYHVHGIEVVCS